jgi:hypothetical protein
MEQEGLIVAGIIPFGARASHCSRSYADFAHALAQNLLCT